jgi:hypothetical protein
MTASTPDRRSWLWPSFRSSPGHTTSRGLSLDEPRFDPPALKTRLGLSAGTHRRQRSAAIKDDGRSGRRLSLLLSSRKPSPPPSLAVEDNPAQNRRWTWYGSPPPMQAFVSRARPPHNPQNRRAAAAHVTPDASRNKKKSAAGQQGTAAARSGLSEPGLFERLLRRRRSNKREAKAPLLDDTPDGQFTEVRDSGFDSDPEDATTSKRRHPTVAPPQRPRTAPGYRPSPLDTGTMVPDLPRQSPSPDAQMLKREPSLKDRLRFRSASIPPPEPEPRRRAYVPRHAAADFSRTAVAPRYRNSDDEVLFNKLDALTPILAESEAGVDEVGEEATAEPQPAQEPALNSAAEAASQLSAGRTGPAAEQLEHTEQNDVSEPGPSQEPATKDRASSNYIPIILDEPQQRIPDTEVSRPQEKSEPLEEEDAPSEEPTEFQQFLARAEAEDRAYRVQVWRNLSTGPRAVPLPPTRLPAPGLDEIPEGVDPPLPPDFSTGTTAVHPRKSGHPKRATWDSAVSGAYVLGAGAVTDEHQAQEGGLRPARRTSPDGADAQQPRGLRRQTSLAKRIGEYIRPPRVQAYGVGVSEEEEVKKPAKKQAKATR